MLYRIEVNIISNVKIMSKDVARIGVSLYGGF
jgi:hypothetical protein